MQKPTLAIAAAAVLTVAGLSAQEAKLGKVAGTLSTEVKLLTRGPLSQAEIVVYLVPDKPVTPTGKLEATANQKRLKFLPRVLPVTVGTKVTFLNEDRVKHNVFSDADCCKLDVDMDKGEKKEHVFAKAGEYPIVCRIHPEMQMTVLVLDTQHFATGKWKKQKGKNANGKRFYLAEFAIEGVPPGKYTLKTWNKKLGEVSQPIVVAAGANDAGTIAVTKKD